MKNYAIIIFESALAGFVPGFRSGEAVGTFPFWGDYSFIDFTLASLLTKTTEPVIIATQSGHRATLEPIIQRWPVIQPEYIDIKDSFKELVSTIGRLNCTNTIIAACSTVALYNGDDIRKIFSKNKSNKPIHLSVEKNPIDVFMGESDQIASILKSLDNKVSGPPFERVTSLFSKHLPLLITKKTEIHGRFLFRDNVRQIYRQNRWIVENIHSKECQSLCHPLTNIPDYNHQSTIGNKGSVKESLISPGTYIGGKVEGSIIFPGCSTAEGSVVINSVIMNNNAIGSGANIFNSVIFPHDGEPGSPRTGNKPSSRRPAAGHLTIGARAQIGRKTSNVVNSDYPHQIRGLTVIGMNPDIPPGAKIESGCYIEPDVTSGRLVLSKVPSGTSVFVSGKNK